MVKTREEMMRKCVGLNTGERNRCVGMKETEVISNNFSCTLQHSKDVKLGTRL